jgi:hypothetical protein
MAARLHPLIGATAASSLVPTSAAARGPGSIGAPCRSLVMSSRCAGGSSASAQLRPDLRTARGVRRAAAVDVLSSTPALRGRVAAQLEAFAQACRHRAPRRTTRPRSVAIGSAGRGHRVIMTTSRRTPRRRPRTDHEIAGCSKASSVPPRRDLVTARQRRRIFWRCSRHRGRSHDRLLTFVYWRARRHDVAEALSDERSRVRVRVPDAWASLDRGHRHDGGRRCVRRWFRHCVGCSRRSQPEPIESPSWTRRWGSQVAPASPTSGG